MSQQTPMPDHTDPPSLTHLHPEGGVRMVHVGSKPDTMRTALASGRVELGEAAFRALLSGRVRKGDAFSTAQVAGIMAGKKTSALIPLCHNVPLTGIDVEMEPVESAFAVLVRARAACVGRTGVEMEALTAVSVACLTLYDMCKSISGEIRIADIHLCAKTGGVRGPFRHSSREDRL